VNLTIDGRDVSARPGESVLDCALRHDVDIPHLCSHPNLPAFGACRMCVVEIDGVRGYPAACTTAAASGMVVRTNTPALIDLRRRVLELMLVEHPSSCIVCDKKELCEQYRAKSSKAGRTTGCHTCNNKDACDVRDLSAALGVERLPVAPAYRGVALRRSDPFIDSDPNLCILCGRCVRICKAHHDTATIDFVGRGFGTKIGVAFGRSLSEAGCRFCGSCVDVCPTGSLADRYGKWFGAPQIVTATTCALCDAACVLEVGADGQGRAFRARALGHRLPICVLGHFALPAFLGGADRLSKPKVRIGEVLREVSWREALESASARLEGLGGESFAFVCDGSSTLEDRHVFEKFTRDVMHSPHFLVLETDAHGVSRGSLPAQVKAALVTGDFVAPADLDALDLLIVLDCYPTPTSERADVVLPAAVLTEVAGTSTDDQGRLRPLHRCCDAPGEARPDWHIVASLARAMGAAGFAWQSAREVAFEMDLTGAELRIVRDRAPAAALDPTKRRTHFRGHRLEDTVLGLATIESGRTTPTGAPAGG
jgi:predicted molibdopterin-dependent oxidoreductase YjgC